MKRITIIGIFAVAVSLGLETRGFAQLPKLYVGGAISDNVVIVDPITGLSAGPTFTHPNLNGPMSIVFAPNGNYFVGSGLADGILEVTPGGSFVNFFNTPHGPSGITIGSNGHLFVTIFGELNLVTFQNTPDNRVIEYTTSGLPVQTISRPDMLGPAAITHDVAGNLYVATSNTALPGGPGQRVFKFDPNGNYLTDFSDPLLDGALGVAVRSNGNIYVSSFHNDQIIVFNPAGQLVNSFTHSDLNGPSYMTFHPNGDLYVSGVLSDSVVVFDPNGAYLRTLTAGIPNAPYGLAFIPEPATLHLLLVGLAALLPQCRLRGRRDRSYDLRAVRVP